MWSTSGAQQGFRKLLPRRYGVWRCGLDVVALSGCYRTVLQPELQRKDPHAASAMITAFSFRFRDCGAEQL